MIFSPLLILVWCASKHIFETLGFVEKTIGKGLTLRLPVTDPSTSQGRQNRAKLLRAWVEISAWIVDFRRIYGRLIPSPILF
jgi:ubiquitin carboxyl-terminal hydrolase 25/28